ncbi:MAG: hypothetical protein ACI9PZ_002576, partial [Parvicella sp.]
SGVIPEPPCAHEWHKGNAESCIRSNWGFLGQAWANPTKIEDGVENIRHSLIFALIHQLQITEDCAMFSLIAL